LLQKTKDQLVKLNHLRDEIKVEEIPKRMLVLGEARWKARNLEDQYDVIERHV
jgi:hypothetical protein